MKTEQHPNAHEDLDVTVYARARGWGDPPDSALRAAGCHVDRAVAVALTRDLERDPDVLRRIERERAKCKAAGRDPTTPRAEQLSRIRADHDRLSAVLDGPDAGLLLDIVCDRLSATYLGTNGTNRREATRRVLRKMMPYELLIRSAPELFKRLGRATAAGRRVPKQLRREIDTRFGAGTTDNAASLILEMKSHGRPLEDLVNVPTRVLAHAHATVAELYGPAVSRRE